jgi:hypothetical protein
VLNDKIPRAGVDSLVFLVDPSTISTTDPGYYFVGGRVVEDSIADFEAFYEPIRAALLSRLGDHEDDDGS